MSPVYVTVVNRANLQRHTNGKMSLERSAILFLVSTIIVVNLVKASEIAAEDSPRVTINTEAYRGE